MRSSRKYIETKYISFNEMKCLIRSAFDEESKISFESREDKTPDHQSMSVDDMTVCSLDDIFKRFEAHNKSAEEEIEQEDELDDGNLENIGAVRISTGHDKRNIPFIQYCHHGGLR